MVLKYLASFKLIGGIYKIANVTNVENYNIALFENIWREEILALIESN